MTKACACGAVADGEAAYCGTCGRALVAGVPEWLSKSCARCGRAYPSSARFCDACGSPLHDVPPKPRTLILADPRGRSVTVEGRSREFGRSDFGDWVPPDAGKLISRAQFRISGEGSDFVIQHLSTANPTVLNGSEVARPRRLARGDVIDLAQGALRLLVRIE